MQIVIEHNDNLLFSYSMKENHNWDTNNHGVAFDLYLRRTFVSRWHCIETRLQRASVSEPSYNRMSANKIVVYGRILTLRMS